MLDMRKIPRYDGGMRQFFPIFMLVVGIPGMVDDIRAWSAMLGVDLPTGGGTALVATAVVWGMILVRHRAGESWWVSIPVFGDYYSLKQLRKIEETLEEFRCSDSIEYVRINEVVLRLRKIRITYPEAGIDRELRRTVTEKLLSACRAGDLKAARSAWQETKDGWAAKKQER